MSEVRRQKGRDIPLRINGTSKYIKGVNNCTTIGDVIKMVLRKSSMDKENVARDSFGIFESSRGIERLLPGKCKVMKVMRSWASSEDFVFVFRKVNPVVSVPKVSEAKRRKLDMRSRDVVSMSNINKYEKPAALAELVHSQRLKLNKLDGQTGNEFVKEIYFNEQENSMDEFISSVDKQKMANFLDFCGTVTSQEINRLSSNCNRRSSSTINKYNNITKRHVLGQSRSSNETRDSLVSSNNVTVTSKVNHVKYAVRKTLKPKTVSTAPMTRQTSATSGGQCQSDKRKSAANIAESSSLVHSTPCLRQIRRTSEPRKRHERLASTITSQISRMNQREGKEALLRKYFNDYISYQSPSSRYRDTKFRGRGDGAEMDVNTCSLRRSLGDGSEQTPVYRRYNTRSTPVANVTESDDSGQEDESCSADFDDAFLEEVETLDDNNISGICRLVDYSLSESEDSRIESPLHNSVVSDLSDDIECDAVNDADSDVSSISDVVRNIFSEVGDDEDEDMESFMKTRLDDEFSDEGLSSLGSDDEREILV